MKTASTFCAAALVIALAAPAVRAQEFPKPGPEHEILKKMEGTWDLTAKVGGAESKGTVTYKMDLGGLWLVGTVERGAGGSRFSGRGYDTYDTAKKKYVAVWVDSTSARPTTMEGTYDKATKTMTMHGEGPGADGKPTRYKSVSEWKDDDTVVYSMYAGDGREPALTIAYKRRAADPRPKEPAGEKDSGFPDLVAALKASPGCLGVETARTDSGKSVIFAWFEDKKAALKWYHSDTHQKLIRQFFPDRGERDRKPLADVPDDGGPIMVVASVTPADKPTKENPRPFKQIAIEIYQPLGGGLALGRRFAPKELKLPPRKDKPEK
jgi:hypothetical protein